MNPSNNVVPKDDVARAVFMAPWKTPSQYAAYANTVQKALRVKDLRVAKHQDRRSLQSDKAATDTRIHEHHEARRKAVLRNQQESGRRIATQVQQRAATPTARMAVDRTPCVPSLRCSTALDGRLHPQPAVSAAQLRTSWNASAPISRGKPPLPLSAEGDVTNRTPRGGALPPLPERDDNADDAGRVKLAAKEGHYIFQDEVGLIDIDDGESTHDSCTDDEEEFDLAADPNDSGAHRTSHSKPSTVGVEPEGAALACAPTSEDEEGTQALADLLLTDENILRFMSDVDEETEEILRAMRGDDERAPFQQKEDEDLDWIPHQRHSPHPHDRRGSCRDPRTRRCTTSSSAYAASQNRSIAVYLSSLRPNGLRAIVDIEASRRALIERRWLEQWDVIAGNFTRQLAARRIKDNSTQRNVNVVVEQEAALRISLVARCSASLDRLKRDELLMCKKIVRMAKFRGRLNEREDAYAKDDEKQKDLLEKLAHKMLDRVMRQDTDDDVLVDNTDPWAGRRRSSVGEKGARRLSAALRTSVVLHNFYGNQQRRKTLRRPSATPLGPLPEEGLPASGGSGLMASSGGQVSLSRGHAPGEPQGVSPPPAFVSFDMCNDGRPSTATTATRQRRPSTLPSPPALRQRQMSVWAAPEGRGDVSPLDHARSLAFPGDSQTSSYEHDVNPAVDEAEEAAKKRALRNQAKEERWKRDAQELASGLKHELLHDRRPNFSKTYHERLQLFEQGQHAKTLSPGMPNASPAESVFGNFRAFLQQSTAEPFAFGSPSDATTLSTTKTPPPASAVLCARDFDVSESDDGDDMVNMDPVAAALHQHQRSAQARHDARLAEYKQATSRHDLNQAVDAMIAGRVRRQTTFEQMAGMPTKRDKHKHQHRPKQRDIASPARGPMASKRIDSPGGYLVDKQPEHTDFDVTAAAAEIMSLSSKVDFLIATSGGGVEGERAKVLRNHPSSQRDDANNNPVKLLRRESLARLKTSAQLDSSRASFAAFDVEEAEQEPPSLGALGRRPSSFFHLKGGDGHPTDGAVTPHGRSGGGTPGELTLSTSSQLAPASVAGNSLRRKRSNVAALLVTSGLGRHDVAQTRIIGDGDTLLYSKQRAREGSASSLRNLVQHQGGDASARDAALTDAHAVNEDEKPQRQFSWSHTTHRSDDAKAKPKAVQFVRDDEEVAAVAPMLSEQHSAPTTGNSSPVFDGVPVASCGSFQWGGGACSRGVDVGGALGAVGLVTDSLHRATTVLADSSRPKGPLALAEQTPDTWCLDASDFS